MHRELIRLCAGFLDQGQAQMPMPGRGDGFLAAVAALYASVPTSPRLAPGTGDDFARIHRDNVPAAIVIGDCLAALGVVASERAPFVEASLVALAGWAGLFSRLELHPEEALPEVPVRLLDFLAVRLVIERHAVAEAARELGTTADLQCLRDLLPHARGEAEPVRVMRLFALMEPLGWSPHDIAALTDGEVRAFFDACSDFTDLTRRRVWHEAYEAWYARHVLDAIAARRTLGPRPRPDRAAAQFVFCIDEREESIRRAIEEHGPEFETFGAAGFFGVAIDFRGLYDAEPAAHCPVVVVPDHEVREAPLYTAEGWDGARRRMRATWHAMHRGTQHRSRTLIGGALASVILGPLAATVALLRVAFPRASLNTFLRWRERLVPRPATRLAALRDSAADRGIRG